MKNFFKSLEDREDWKWEARFVESSIKVLYDGNPLRDSQRIKVYLNNIEDEAEPVGIVLKLKRENSLKNIAKISISSFGYEPDEPDLEVYWVRRGYHVSYKQIKILSNWLMSPSSIHSERNNLEEIWSFLMKDVWVFGSIIDTSRMKRSQCDLTNVSDFLLDKIDTQKNLE